MERANRQRRIKSEICPPPARKQFLAEFRLAADRRRPGRLPDLLTRIRANHTDPRLFVIRANTLYRARFTGTEKYRIKRIREWFEYAGDGYPNHTPWESPDYNRMQKIRIINPCGDSTFTAHFKVRIAI